MLVLTPSARPTAASSEPADPPAPRLQSRCIRLSAEDQRGAQAFWTPEKMRAAPPLPLPVLTREQQERLRRTRGPAPPRILTIPSSDGPGGQGEMQAANVKERPFWNGGKLFTIIPEATQVSCSAQFVGSDRVVMTAGHCVMGGGTGKWYALTIFSRAFDDGGGQSVQPDKICVPEQWAANGSSRYDYAFMHMTTASGAGYLGFQTGVPYATWWAIGYPKNWNGAKTMAKDEGSKGMVNPGWVEMLNNPMSHGSSGGAWIGELTTDRAAGNYAIGLNSWKSNDASTIMNGPPFDQDTYDLLRSVQSESATGPQPTRSPRR